MQIKIQLNSDCTSKISENVVQKILAASNPRQNETHHEWMYIQVSSTSYCKIVNKSHHHHYHHRHQWSLCSVDKLKLNFICLFVRIFLLDNDWWPFYSRLLQLIHMSNNRQYHQQCERFQSPATTDIVTVVCQPMHEAASNKNFISFFHLKTTSKKFYKILLNLFYGHYLWYQQQHPAAFNPDNSVNEFCDLSTNSENVLFINMNENDNNNVKCMNNNNNITNKNMIYVKYGIEYHRYVVKSTTSSLTTEKLRNGLRTLNFFYGILLIQRHLLLCNNYEFSNNQCERINNLIMRHQILRHLLAHNQIVLYITSICHYSITFKFFTTTDRTTLSIENGIAAITTSSNHKLKMSHDDNDNCYQQQHRNSHHNEEENEEFSNCFQHFPHRPAFRSNDSVKSHLNAILFLIILCIPLLTTAAASSVHNLKYSTNVVKTKYGPIRGIVMRQNPTVEGYLGVPYGKAIVKFLTFFPQSILFYNDYTHSFTRGYII